MMPACNDESIVFYWLDWTVEPPDVTPGHSTKLCTMAKTYTSRTVQRDVAPPLITITNVGVG